MEEMRTDTKVEASVGFFIGIGHAFYKIIIGLWSGIMVHKWDIILSLILGFLGAAGAWLWHQLVNKVKNYAENRRKKKGAHKAGPCKNCTDRKC